MNLEEIKKVYDEYALSGVLCDDYDTGYEPLMSFEEFVKALKKLTYDGIVLKPECAKCSYYTGIKEHGSYRCHVKGYCPAYKE